MIEYDMVPRVGDYVKCCTNDEIGYGTVISVKTAPATYPYTVDHYDDPEWGVCLYEESELTVVVNENIMNELVDNMVLA